MAPSSHPSSRHQSIEAVGRMRANRILLMKRVILGWLFIAHALAHAGLGVWIAGDGPPFLLELLWTVALVGYLAAGLAVLRVPVLREHWKPILGAAAVSSILLCIAFSGVIGLLGFAV